MPTIGGGGSCSSSSVIDVGCTSCVNKTCLAKRRSTFPGSLSDAGDAESSRSGTCKSTIAIPVSASITRRLSRNLPNKSPNAPRYSDKIFTQSWLKDMVCCKASGGGAASISTIIACKQCMGPDGGSIMTLSSAECSSLMLITPQKLRMCISTILGDSKKH